jgi:hypothetical protein
MNALNDVKKPSGRTTKQINGVTIKFVIGEIKGNCLNIRATTGAVPKTAAIVINVAVFVLSSIFLIGCPFSVFLLLPAES